MVHPTVPITYSPLYYYVYSVFLAEKTPVNLPYKSFHKTQKVHEKIK